MSKLSYKVSYYALYAMFAIILIVLGLFYLGGDAQGADVIAGVDPEMWQPANTNALLMLIYGLFGLAVAATVVAAVFQFGAALKDNPKAAIKSFMGLILLAVLLIITYNMGSDAAVTMGGGTVYDNKVMLKVTDMFLYSTYALLIVAAIGTLLNLIGVFKQK